MGGDAADKTGGVGDRYKFWMFCAWFAIEISPDNDNEFEEILEF